MRICENIWEIKAWQMDFSTNGKILSKNRKFSCADRAGNSRPGRSDGRADSGAFAPGIYFICGFPQTRWTGKSPCRYGLCARRTGTPGDRRAEGMDCGTCRGVVGKTAVWHQQRWDNLSKILHQQHPYVSLVQGLRRGKSARALGKCTEWGKTKTVWCVPGLSRPSALEYVWKIISANSRFRFYIAEATRRSRWSLKACKAGFFRVHVLTKKCQKIIGWEYNRKKKHFYIVMQQWENPQKAAWTRDFYGFSLDFDRTDDIINERA